jgi:hypothetical protein
MVPVRTGRNKNAEDIRLISKEALRIREQTVAGLVENYKTQ